MRTWQDEEYKLQHEVIPSPGTEVKDWVTMEKKIGILKPFVKTVHIDILDGKFVNNANFMDPEPFKKYTKDIFFEVHLMVQNPIQYLKPFEEAGFKRFIGQVEQMPDIAEFVAQGQLRGEVGLALDKDTKVEDLPIALNELDVILVMTIKAGFSGQAFIPELLDKVQQIREKSELLPIEIDGGISDKTIVQAKTAGANRFVATSFIFNAPNPSEQYGKLMGLVI